jgi:ribosome-interacting GTPase 1
MPANLPPHYFEAEQRYRDAKTPQAKIEALEEMLTIMPKHKGTDKLKADLRRRIAKHKAEAQQRKGSSKRDLAYAIEKEGAAQVVVIGPPNVGKSSLVAALTNATPEVADFPHTTWKPTPGMAPFENIQFQLVDTPPLTRDYLDPWMADLMRRADILAIVLDLHGDPLQQLEDMLVILGTLRIIPEGLPIPEGLAKKPYLKKACIVLNKMDTAEDSEDVTAFQELAETPLPCVGTGARAHRNLPAFVELLYQLAGVIRVYTKAPGKEPDRSAPFVVPQHSTLADLAGKIHKDFVAKLRFAKLWGRAVFDGQMVQRDYVLQDGDVVEIHI